MQRDEVSSVFGKAKFDDVVAFVEEVGRIKRGGPARSNVQQKKVMRCIIRLVNGLSGTLMDNIDSNNPLIIYRRGRQPEITPLGEHMYKEASQLVLLLKQWRRTFKQHNRGVEIRIGFRGFHWRWLVKPWTDKILQESKGRVSIDFVSNSPGELEKMMFNRKLNFCLVYDGFRDIPGYERTHVATQTLCLAAHIPSHVRDRPKNINDVINSNYAFCMEIARDASSYYDQYRGHHENQPFFLMPQHRFADTNIAWDFFESAAGKGAVGYFSERKLKNSSKNVVKFEKYTIKRDLVLYTREYDSEPASSHNEDIFMSLAEGELSHSASILNGDMLKLMNACRNCWPESC